MHAVRPQHDDMTDLTRMLSDACGHVSMSLSALPNARLLWINARAARQDPSFDKFSGDVFAYGQYLVAQCAYALPQAPVAESERVTAFADRYGGMGIGSNGGSGRAASVNGYYVKGIGPTPLIGKTTNPAHSTGHCTLEECVREAVLSECVDAEFPWGAVPVLAIIGIGVSVPMAPEPGIGLDNPAGMMELGLLIRPNFLRPAHFDRALGFLSDMPKQGFQDSLRVKAMIESGRRIWGDQGLLNMFMQLHARWADQLAYGYAHRFCHGAPSPSNVTLDGRLLDFGAATLPTWAKVHTALGGPVTGQELPFMLRTLQSMLRQIQHQCPELGITNENMSSLAQVAVQRYGQTLAVELLRVLGLHRLPAIHVLRQDHDRTVQIGLNRLLMHYATEYFNTYESTPEPRIAWQLTDFWKGALDRVAPGLREVLISKMQTDIASDIKLDWTTIYARNAKYAETRPLLFRENLRQAILDALRHMQETKNLGPNALDAFIEAMVRCHVLPKDED